MLSTTLLFAAATLLLSAAQATNGFFGMHAVAGFSTTTIKSMYIQVFDGPEGAHAVCSGTVKETPFPAQGALPCTGRQILSWKWNSAHELPVATYQATPSAQPFGYGLPKPDGSAPPAPKGADHFVTVELAFGTVFRPEEFMKSERDARATSEVGSVVSTDEAAPAVKREALPFVA